VPKKVVVVVVGAVVAKAISSSCSCSIFIEAAVVEIEAKYLTSLEHLFISSSDISPLHFFTLSRASFLTLRISCFH